MNSIADCSGRSCSADNFVEKKYVKERRTDINLEVQLFENVFSSIGTKPVFARCTKEHISNAYRNRVISRLRGLSFRVHAMMFAVLSKELKSVLHHGIGKCYSKFPTSVGSAAIRALHTGLF